MAQQPAREQQAQRSTTPSARGLAYEVLSRCARSSKFVTDVLAEALAGVQISSPERRLATELAYGVVRRQGTLDALLKPFVRRGQESVEPELWTLLRLGAYQLIFLSRIPARAAVNETVALAKAAGKSPWTGFINGVLRSLSRSVQEESCTSSAENAIPLGAGQYLRIDRPVFPDPTKQPAAYFAAAFGFPIRLSERWLQRFGFDELVRLGFWFNTPVKPCLRVNLLTVTRETVLQKLADVSIAAHCGTLPEAVWLDTFTRIEGLPGYSEGWLSVQDESAMHAAVLVAPQAGWRVLDLCAAPGGKATHLAELMHNQGCIVATDIDCERLGRLTSARRRLGLSMIETLHIRKEMSDLPDGPFEAVLVDVPCSNTGVLGKRPEARWRVRPGSLAKLQKLQIRLLQAGAERLSKNGRLVYSTCSIEPEENRSVVEAILADFQKLRLVEEKLHVPGKPGDGGYQALLCFDAAVRPALPSGLPFS